MDFIRNIFRKKQHETSPMNESGQSKTDGPNPDFEKLLQREFGLEFRKTGWIFNGSVNQDYVSVLSNTELCLVVIKQLRAKLEFNKICIVIGSPSVLIVCNKTPPLGILTSLNATEIADLIASILKNNGKQVYEYNGVWLFSLS